jgi:hypothetical protein
MAKPGLCGQASESNAQPEEKRIFQGDLMKKTFEPRPYFVRSKALL